MSLSLLALGLFVGQTLSFNCSVTPIYVDIHTRAVHNVESFEWGSFVGFGSPSQNMSLPVSLSNNETSVAEDGFCQHSKLSQCQNSTGGFLETRLSTTWKSTPDYRSTDSDDQSSRSAFFGTDKLHVYTHFFEVDPASQTVVDDFPVKVVSAGDSNPGWLGLGLGSTLLDKLYTNGLISSRSFSFYVGTSQARAGGQINGSVTLGGYDASRFTGTVHNYSISGNSRNPFQVRVSDIIIDGVDGKPSNISLLDKNRFSNISEDAAGFDAEISSEQWPLSLPYEVTQNFKELLNAESSDAPDGSLRLKSPFNGTMSIILSDGFKVSIPAELLYNTSGLTAVADRPRQSNASIALSSAWLSQVYLMADYEAHAFHLAQAVLEAPFISMRTTCPKIVPLPYQDPPRSGFSKFGLVGAIVGGVIGFLALCTALVCIVTVLRRRKAKTAEAQIEKGKKSARIAEFEFEGDGKELLNTSSRKPGRSWFRRGS
ncbi:MAG: hypothetical protein M4579_003435 [Chaenotheca gracillima]|nr:MAG: hypothetical protein M4579_003435 [Chaenotheca gracillima]